jgi:pyridoxamine 5'-phosphate oxidase
VTLEHDADPVARFDSWLSQAFAAGIPNADATALATATPDGQPSVRLVLCKGADERGFVFYTNVESRKGRELEVNPRAALAFYWVALGRQVRVEGAVEPLPPEETFAYFRTRPRASQVGAWASPQSDVIESREFLERRVADIEARYPGDAVPLPPHWGGYRLIPHVIEFWEHRESRLHDRLRYTRSATGWRVDRLAP